MQTSPEKPTRLRSALLVLLVVVALVVTWIGSTRLDDIRTDKELSPRYTNYAIPIALSQLLYEHDHDYTGYYLVAWHFWGNPAACRKPFNLLLAEATTLDEVAVSSSPSWIIPADDKGLVDF